MPLLLAGTLPTRRCSHSGTVTSERLLRGGCCRCLPRNMLMFAPEMVASRDCDITKTTTRRLLKLCSSVYAHVYFCASTGPLYTSPFPNFPPKHRDGFSNARSRWDGDLFSASFRRTRSASATSCSCSRKRLPLACVSKNSAHAERELVPAPGSVSVADKRSKHHPQPLSEHSAATSMRTRAASQCRRALR